MALSQQQLPTYTDLGFSNFFERPMSSSGAGSLTGYEIQTGSRDINFDSSQITGSLGDKIQVGDIVIDGSTGRIEIYENGNPVILIGRDYE